MKVYSRWRYRSNRRRRGIASVPSAPSSAASQEPGQSDEHNPCLPLIFHRFLPILSFSIISRLSRNLDSAHSITQTEKGVNPVDRSFPLKPEKKRKTF